MKQKKKLTTVQEMLDYLNQLIKELYTKDPFVYSVENIEYQVENIPSDCRIVLEKTIRVGATTTISRTLLIEKFHGDIEKNKELIMETLYNEVMKYKLYQTFQVAEPLMVYPTIQEYTREGIESTEKEIVEIADKQNRYKVDIDKESMHPYKKMEEDMFGVVQTVENKIKVQSGDPTKEDTSLTEALSKYTENAKDVVKEREEYIKEIILDILKSAGFETEENKLRTYLRLKDAGIEVFDGELEKYDLKLPTKDGQIVVGYNNGITICHSPNEKPFEDENPISREYTGSCQANCQPNVRITTPTESVEKELYELNPKLTPLQNWINGGKDLIQKEIEEALENLETMYEELAILNDRITDEEERIENLENLLETISL